jgi:hypothetical protein
LSRSLSSCYRCRGVAISVVIAIIMLHPSIPSKQTNNNKHSARVC